MAERLIELFEHRQACMGDGGLAGKRFPSSVATREEALVIWRIQADEAIQGLPACCDRHHGPDGRVKLLRGRWQTLRFPAARTLRHAARESSGGNNEATLVRSAAFGPVGQCASN
jgi:hypothetical protein